MHNRVYTSSVRDHQAVVAVTDMRDQIRRGTTASGPSTTACVATVDRSAQVLEDLPPRSEAKFPRRSGIMSGARQCASDKDRRGGCTNMTKMASGHFRFRCCVETRDGDGTTAETGQPTQKHRGRGEKDGDADRYAPSDQSGGPFYKATIQHVRPFFARPAPRSNAMTV